MKKQAENLLAKLPPGCIKVIAQYCDINTTMTLTKVNTKLRTVATSDETWEIMLKGEHSKDISRFFQKRVSKLITNCIRSYNKPETIDEVVDKNFPKPQLSPIKTIRKLKGNHSFFKAFLNTNNILKSSKPKIRQPLPYENLIAAVILITLISPLLGAMIFESVTCLYVFIYCTVPSISLAYVTAGHIDRPDPRVTRKDIVDILKKINESKDTLFFTDANNIDPDSEDNPCDPISFDDDYYYDMN